jgi:hypothetical protein
MLKFPSRTTDECSALTEDNIPLEEIERLSSQAMDDNIRVLQALAENDRRDQSRPWESGKFILDPRKEFRATVGTVSGFILETVPSMNFPVYQSSQVPPMGTTQRVST